MESGWHLFTVDEAQRLLPVVRQLMDELQEGKRELERRTQTFDQMLALTTGNGHMEEDLAKTRQQAEQLAIQMQKRFGELDALGVQLKDIDDGLVDFPSMQNGRVVLLCWRVGEERIAWWHEVDAGFRGRQAL